MVRSFETCSALGTESEKRIKDYLEGIGYTVLWTPTGRFPYFDLLATDKSGRVMRAEVKRDIYPTQVAAVEYLYKGKPSGINTSTADFYIIDKSSYDSLFWLPRERLRRACAKATTPRQKCCGGQTRCYMVPLDAFEEAWNTPLDLA